MRARHRAQLCRSVQAGEGRKFAHVNFVSPASFGIGDVGKPFQLGRHVGQVAILRRRQRPFPDRHQVFRHPPVFLQPPYPAILTR